MCRWTLLEETRKEAISLIPGLVPHHQHILIMTDIRIFTEWLRFCFMNKLNPSKKKISLSCFRCITVLTKFKLTVQLHFLLFLKIRFDLFIRVYFQHEDVVLVIVLAGAGQLWAMDVVFFRIKLHVFTPFLWQGPSTGLAHRWGDMFEDIFWWL